MFTVKQANQIANILNDAGFFTNKNLAEDLSNPDKGWVNGVYEISNKGAYQLSAAVHNNTGWAEFSHAGTSDEKVKNLVERINKDIAIALA